MLSSQTSGPDPKSVRNFNFLDRIHEQVEVVKQNNRPKSNHFNFLAIISHLLKKCKSKVTPRKNTRFLRGLKPTHTKHHICT